MIEVKFLVSDVHGTTPTGGVSVLKLEALTFVFNQHQ